MKINRKRLIKAIGILTLLVGIIGIFNILAPLLKIQQIHILSKLELIEEYSLFSDSSFNTAKSVIQLIFYSTMIIAGLLLFKLKPIGRFLIVFLCWFHLYYLFLDFAVEGLIWNEIYFIILVPSTIFILIFFCSKSINLIVQYKKGIKIISIILSIIFIISVIIYSIIIIKVNNYGADYVSIEFQPSNFKDIEVVRFDFSNLYSIDLPLNKVQIVLKATNLDGQNLGFANVDDSLACVIYYSLDYDFINENKLKSLNKSDLNISKKILNEKFGLKYLSLNGKIDGLFSQSTYEDDFLEFKNNGLVFEYTYFGKSNTFTLYKQEKNIGALDFVNLKSEGKRNNVTIETSFIKELLSSIKPINDKSKTAENYYEEGLFFYKNKKFKRALLKFYSSLSIDSDNTDCKIYFLKSFISTEDFTYPNEKSKWYRTQVSLENMLKENPDNKNVQNFYVFVKSEAEKYE